MNINRNFIDTGIWSLPPQMIPSSQKTEQWGKETMDRLESIGRRQHLNNVKLMENYELIKGKFIFKHYFEEEGYADMIGQLTKEFELPNYLRHYDITSQVINTLSGEWQKRPDTFRVKSFGERYENDFLRAKTEMLKNYIQYNINAEINKKLIEQGIDQTREDFASEEERQQFVQLVEQQKEILTPKEIELYMSTKWMQIAEIWGQHQIEFDKQRFNFPEKEKKEFEDMLIADRCFRHFYLTGDSYNQETWNPINTFFHKSPEVDYIEDGDYVGRVFYLTVNDIIDRYGWMMDKDTLDNIRGDASINKWQDKDAYGVQYGSVVPYEGYGQNKVFTDALGADPMTSLGIPTIGKEFFESLHTDTYSVNTAGLLQVTEAYWKSQKKIGKIIFFDEDGVLTKQLVDENFIVPNNFKELDSSIFQSEEPDTVTWTWINEVWKGIKINARNSRTFTEDIYLDIKPLEFQFKGDLNPYNAKLPVCGQVFSTRNSKSMSLVDMIKPHQIGYNVAMNQLYQIMEREIGRFVVMDVNLFPGLKDWGGEKAWEKFMLVAKNLGLAPVDTSPQNINNAASVQGGHYPKDIDLDETSRMASRIKIAEFFESMALKQVGFNDYRLGNYSGEATAAGIEQGSKTSYAQTESYFTNFSNYLRRCYTMNLDIAQYTQSKKDSVTISYIKSDLSRSFIKIAGTELMGNQMGVFVSNSQEQLRQLESIRQLALTNNTSGATMPDLIDIITMNSPQEIKLQLEKSNRELQDRENRKLELQQKELEYKAQADKAREELEDLRLDKELASKEKIAYINTFRGQTDNLKDGDNNNNQPDIIEYEKLQSARDTASSKLELDRNKQIMEKEKMITDKEIAMQKLALERRKIEASIEIENKNLEIVKAMKKKDSTKKK